MSRDQFIATLDGYADAGRIAQFWLRDDDAIAPTALLGRLLDLSERYSAPMTIASIPATATEALAGLLADRSLISVAVHGWDHANHAPPPAKKQELGLHRGEGAVLSQLDEGLKRIKLLFGDRAIPLLVPPWNRIAAELVPHLSVLGYEALSVFGPERSDSSIKLVNTHVDVIDWKGSRGGRPMEALYAEATKRLELADTPNVTIGVLTHHLVHDEAAWAFLKDFLALTSHHTACRWVTASELMAQA